LSWSSAERQDARRSDEIQSSHNCDCRARALGRLEKAKIDYCVDTARVFSVGFSYGGMMSYAIGCALSGTFRAIAPMSGATISGCKLSGKPIAMWGSHGKSDTGVSLSSGQQPRDKILKQNGRKNTTKPVDPSPCVEYDCPADYRVVWCECDGSQATPSFSPGAIAGFFKKF
jgi:polyhydroxybutyrate depolymerase